MNNCVRALIIVDLQNDFITGSLGLGSKALKVVSVVSKLCSNEFFKHVYYSKDSHPINHCSFLRGDSSDSTNPKRKWPMHCVKGTEGWQIHQDIPLRPRLDGRRNVFEKGTLIDSDSFSAFGNFLIQKDDKTEDTGLLETMIHDGVTDAFVCGLCLDVCVEATINDTFILKKSSALKDLNNIYLLLDATAALNNSMVSSCLNRLEKKGVCVVNSSEIIARK